MSLDLDPQATLLDALPDNVVRELSAEELSTLSRPDSASILRRAFLIPPFSVLDTRSGEWQERRRWWLDFGIESELGRGGGDEEGTYEGRGGATSEKQDGLLLPPSTSDPAFYAKKRAVEAELGHEITTEEFQRDHWEPPEGTGLSATGTSVFDPVLCELVYRWFSPPGGAVLDPFAGGSVRGVVAAILGRRYEGVDLAERQIVENREQWTNRIAPTLPGKIRAGAVEPTWHAGDSRQRVPAMTITPDLVFTCPPYYDLEVYSDDPRDLSAEKTYGGFLEGYQDVLFKAVGRLAEHRFVCVVIGDVRDKGGFYRGLVRDTIDALEAAGAAYYNHAIIVNSVGSLPVRAGRQFRTMRKLGKTHQDLIVAFKGDPREIRSSFPEITT